MIRGMRQRVRVHDEGITLVELLVVMMLSALVMTLAGTMFINVARATTSANGLRQSTAEAANIMTVASTDIRAGTRVPRPAADPYPAVQPGSSDRQLVLVTFSDTGPVLDAPIQVRYRVDRGRMLQERWASSTTFPLASAPPFTRILGESVNATGPIFTYYDLAGARVTDLSTESQRAKVASIRVELTVTAPQSSESVKIVNDVGMPNVRVG